MSQEYKVKVDNDGTVWYFKFGTDELHRLDGPAVVYPNGTKTWYQDGKMHRTDGPAVEYADGTKKWYQYDKLHRTDGPAVECANGNVDYWIDNKRLTPTQFKKATASKEMTIAEIEAILGHAVKIVN